MSAIHVPPKLWREFLRQFSEQHADEFIRLATHDNQTDESVSSGGSTLYSIALDEEDEENPRINVSVVSDRREVKHILFRPSHVTLIISESDGAEALQIQSLNAETTIHCHAVKPAEGVA